MENYCVPLVASCFLDFSCFCGSFILMSVHLMEPSSLPALGTDFGGSRPPVGGCEGTGLVEYGSSGSREDPATWFPCSFFSEVNVGIDFRGSQWPSLQVLTVAEGTLRVFASEVCWGLPGPPSLPVQSVMVEGIPLGTGSGPCSGGDTGV